MLKSGNAVASQSASEKRTLPLWGHRHRRDRLGRDLLSKLIYGAQTSLIIGIVANGVAMLIGTILGVIAGYLGGWAGTAIMRFTDLMMAFPT